VWRRKSAEQYLKQANTFLELLLLLFHILGGQPSLGTELFSLQLRNTIHGLRRNIFIENGLVNFVSFYHKGYSVSGSSKIIHRYLPEAINELLVLSVIKKGTYSEPWPSCRLTNVLAQQFNQHLNTDANILLWRHAAIAICTQLIQLV
jgi:hypothetical protein